MVKQHFLRVLVLGGGLLAAVAVHSQPAPWYWWVSKLDGKRVCAQFMPAQGWQRSHGPFDNARCTPPRRALLSMP